MKEFINFTVECRDSDFRWLPRSLHARQLKQRNGELGYFNAPTGQNRLAQGQAALRGRHPGEWGKSNMRFSLKEPVRQLIIGQ